MQRLFFIALIVCYLLVVIPLASYMKARPVEVKLGYLPEAQVLKIAAAEHRYLVAESLVIKVLFYFGTLIENQDAGKKIQPEYFNMFRSMERAVKLDPYNLDAYYFTQAAFTWELGRAADVNKVLAYGMKYRTWDYQLPFYAGFNAAYFLHDYRTAARYMQRAAELSGQQLFTTLASRYFYEAGQTELGVMFLDVMSKGAKDPGVKKAYDVRREALNGVILLDQAVAAFKAQNGRLPASLDELAAKGFIESVPVDPYGGTFYLEPSGKVASTSKFAFGGQRAK